MGVLKIAGKVVGTVTFGAAGVLSAVIENGFEKIGSVDGAENFGKLREASFNQVRKLWSNNTGYSHSSSSEENESRKSIEKRIDRCEKCIVSVRSFYNKAKELGDQEKAEEYAKRLENLKNEIRTLKGTVMK